MKIPFSLLTANPKFSRSVTERCSAMKIEKGQIVRSIKGHDSGQLFCVMDAAEGYVFLADGKRRRVSCSKRKNEKHVCPAGEWKHPTIEKVRTGQTVGDGELRAALAVIRDQMEV